MPAAAAIRTPSEPEMAGQGFLEVDRLSVGYGGPPVLQDVSLAVAKGEFVALLGSSGCGKTTLLRTIAGFARPISGTILADGRDITRLPPDRREMALVFQSYALWPHMTVRQNVGYGLKLRRVPRDKADGKIDELLAMLGLEGFGERNVTALSGGQRQRVALGRALAIDPQILLLDEPLSNLDARIRQTVRHEIRALQKRLGITAIHVTHDREEAMVMADRIVILNSGRIEQLGPPEEVYNRPGSPFVARFMGAGNVVELTAEKTGGRVVIEAGPHNLSAAWSGADLLPQGRDFQVLAFFRSEAAQLGKEEPGNHQASSNELILTGHVTQVSYPGGTWRHAVKVGGSELQVDSPVQLDLSEPVRVRVPSESVFLFPRSSDTEASTGSAELSDQNIELAEGSRYIRGSQ